MKRLLYVGAGHDRGRPYQQYTGDEWEVTRLDADPATEPNLCLDAGKLTELAPDEFDAVAIRHMLEHVAEDAGLDVLRGCLHVLKPGGEVRVSLPNLLHAARVLVERGPDVVAYVSGVGPIRPLDMIYGHQQAISQGTTQGKGELMGHRWGYTARTLRDALEEAGFAAVGSTADDQPGATEIEAWGVKP